MFLTVVLVRWIVFVMTLPVRLIAGEGAHVTAYTWTMRIVGLLSLLAIIAAIAGN